MIARASGRILSVGLVPRCLRVHGLCLSNSCHSQGRAATKAKERVEEKATKVATEREMPKETKAGSMP